MPPKELPIVVEPTKEPCFYLVTCGLCDEQETCQKDQDGHAHWLVKKRMDSIGAKILVMSNKGGVGKSSVTTNLAACLNSIRLADRVIAFGDSFKIGQALHVLVIVFVSSAWTRARIRPTASS